MEPWIVLLLVVLALITAVFAFAFGVVKLLVDRMVRILLASKEKPPVVFVLQEEQEAKRLAAEGDPGRVKAS